MVVLKTIVLKIYYCGCKGCDKILVQLGRFRQVQKIDRDAENLKASILVTGDPDEVIKALKKDRSSVEYFEHTLAMNEVTKSLKKPDNQKTRLVKKTKVCCPEGNHELELESYDKRFACDGCKEDGFGSRYRCKDCDYSLHKECKSPKPIISPDFLQGSAFKFCHQPCARPCFACGKAIRGYFYRCKSKELDLHLHPCCSNLKRKLNGMDFVPRDKKIPASSKSMCCENKMPRGSCSYISTCEKYHFHVYCTPKMLHKAWEKGVTSPKTMDLQPRKPNNSNRKGGRFGQILKTLSTFAGAIVGILLGDPTGLIGGVLIDLFWNMLLPKFPPKLPSK